MSDPNSTATLSQSFDDALKKWNEIENSEHPMSEILQESIETTIQSLEKLTITISYLGVFSSNEIFDDISTDSLKFFLLPVFLGSLTLRKSSADRSEVLRVASIYFKDFLERCHSYQLTDFKFSNEDNCDEMPKSRSNNEKTSIEDLKKMSHEREKKIERYKQKVELDKKLANLKTVIQDCTDDEVIREYYGTMIKQLIHRSVDELYAISIEQKVLKFRDAKKDQPEQPIPLASKPLQPFLITKDSIQKKVFGAGYPSLPVLSVEEFYEQKVKEGWFPPPVTARAPHPAGPAPPTRANEGEQSQSDQEESRENLIRRDEWRDTHRTGWGNTYNRS